MDFNTLHTEYEHFFDIVKNPKVGTSYNNAYFMAFDAEWYNLGGRNVVLSYQIATVSPSGSQNIIEFVPPGERLKLADIVEFGIRSVNDGCIPEGHATSRNLVILISHSTVAEWSVLADRDAPYITSQLTAIRKSPVTSIHPIKIILGDYICPCHVQLYDTRLIAPADFQNLKKLSTMLGSEDELKVNIGYHALMRMDRLIKIDYPLYEKYALQDSAITLKLFFLLQSNLMKLAEYDKKLYRTLASGAVKGYEHKAVNFKTYQTALKSDYFKPSYDFIRLAYHGGRNEGFMVGRSDQITGIKERLWVDIDFTGCYPTAMALCPTIDCGVDPFVKPLRYTKKNPAPDIIPGEIKYLPLRHKLPDMSPAELKKTGINKDDYDKGSKILNKMTPDIKPEYYAQLKKEWNRFLDDLSSHDRKRIVEKALVFDNSLIDEWYVRYKTDTAAERCIIPGFARVRFAFDVKVVDGVEVKKDEKDGDYIPCYPCLPVPHPSYGLIYPIEGDTYATVPEIMLALDAGCHIKAMESVELPVVKDRLNGIPKRLFFEHLAELTVERNLQKKNIKWFARRLSLLSIFDSMKSSRHYHKNSYLLRIHRKKNNFADAMQKAIVLERFTKEFMNSFYGKTAQAVNFKKMYDPDTGSMLALGPSTISEACTAALATGLPRSALSAVLMAIDIYNRQRPHSERIIVASCTTDGLLVGLPRPEGVTAAAYYEEKVKKLIEPVIDGVGGGETSTKYHEMKKGTPTVNEVLTLCGCASLIPKIVSYLPIRQMHNSRIELTEGEDDTFLEIKHFADQVAGIKTRGQIGWIDFNGERVVTIQAKFGLKPPVTNIIQRNDEFECMDTMNEKKSMKELHAEYDRIMSVGGSVKATLECNWILEQIERINSGETDLFEYTYYGLKSFNEIIKSGRDLDLTQTVGDRLFNADYDWKRKLVVTKDGKVSPFSVPHQDIGEMRSHRNLLEKYHRWGKAATPEIVIQSEAVKNSGINLSGGMEAAVVKQFLTGMLFDHISGGVKVADCSGKKNNQYDRIVAKIQTVWNECGCSFVKSAASKPKKEGKGTAKKKKVVIPRPDKVAWYKSDVQHITRNDRWVASAIPFQTQFKELLTALCEIFKMDYDEAKERIFATKVGDNVNAGLMLQVALAILKAPAQGIDPFKRLYLMEDRLRTKEQIIKAFHPHVTESIIASYEHIPFQKGQCRSEDKGMLVMYFMRTKMRKDDAELCAAVMMPVNEKRVAVHNRSKGKIVRIFAQALCNMVKPPVSDNDIMAKLRRHGLDVAQFHSSRYSKFERKSIQDTTENRKVISKLARLFAMPPDQFFDEMLDK